MQHAKLFLYYTHFCEESTRKKNKKSKYRLNYVILNRRVFLIIRKWNVYCTHINTTELNYRLRRKKTECHTFVKICHFSMEHPSILWTLFGWLAHRFKPATWYQYTFSESSLTIANNGGLFIIQTILCCSHFNQ